MKKDNERNNCLCEAVAWANCVKFLRRATDENGRMGRIRV